MGRRLLAKRYCKGGHHHKMGAGNWDHHPGNRRFITNFKKQRRERGDDDGGETDGGKTAHGLTSKATTSSTFVETKQDPEPAHEVGTLQSTTTTAGLLRSEKSWPATPRLHHHHHHETRIGTHHVVPGGLLSPWTPIFVKCSIFSYSSVFDRKKY